MISLATALAIGNGAKTALSSATSGAKGAVRRLRLAGIVDVNWLDLGLSSEAGFSADQAADVHEFVRSARIAPILSIIAQMQMLEERPAELLQNIELVFLDEAKHWTVTHGTGWERQARTIWARLIDLYQMIIPEMHDQLSSEISNYASFVSSPLQSQTAPSGAAARYLDRVAELSTDLDQLVSIATKASAIITQIRAAEHQPMITYRSTDGPTHFNSLFVTRTIAEYDSDHTDQSDVLVSSGSPFRVILTGPPGAGKTTLVRHIVAANADGVTRNPEIATIVVKCKDYVAQAWSTSIAEHASIKVAAEYGVPLIGHELEGILLLGRAVVIFDGLDEVTDLSRRAEMVQRIHSFTALYPATSILVTSREVGYDRAPLSTAVFRRMRLDEFTEDQTRTYCEKWFGKDGRLDLVDHFMTESATILDLRRNPLLLSLLCMLYRERGNIPSNRRQTYQQCAELLFQRWDTHRQIAQVGSIPNFGDRLMQEIARWFYQSSTAQGTGLEEQQIAKAIGNYMVAALGFAAERAERDARDFLQFCADRAWLLGSVGTNSRGDRLFQFVHRTFYEYFAAEAIVRSCESVEEVASNIWSSYAADSTSVVPELLIQAYDYGHERGATNVFLELCRLEGMDDDLILRLMDGSILTQYARQPGFKLLVAHWSRSNVTGMTPLRNNARWSEELYGRMRTWTPSSGQFTALLSLNELARQDFVNEFLLKDPAARRVFLRGWASLQLSGFGDAHTENWNEVVGVIVHEFAEEISALRDAEVVNWIATSSDSFIHLIELWEHVVCEGAYGWTPGVVWWALDSNLIRGSALPPNPARDSLIVNLAHRLGRGEQIPRAVVQRLREAVEEIHLELVEWRAQGSGNLDPVARASNELMTYLLLAMFEESGEATLIDAASSVWPFITRLTTLRGLASEPSTGGREPAQRLPSLDFDDTDVAPICRSWASGQHNFIDFG